MTPTESDHITDEILSAYVEGELDQDDADVVQRHVAHCEQCCAVVEELESTRALLGGLCKHKAPMSFTRRVQGRIRRRSRGRFFSTSTPGAHRTTYLVAAIVLVILAALYFFSLVSPEVRDGSTGMGGDELRQHREMNEGTGNQNNLQHQLPNPIQSAPEKGSSAHKVDLTQDPGR